MALIDDADPHRLARKWLTVILVGVVLYGTAVVIYILA